MLVLKGLVGLHRTIQFHLFRVTGWGIDLNYHDIEWFALETNRDHSVVFETTSKYCILDSLGLHHIITLINLPTLKRQEFPDDPDDWDTLLSLPWAWAQSLV